ncbi:hypothetical protein RHMOL_Rhmol06G0143600 [Rhododendron molle]|uniref:Uncharacterized protein n=1 Tax=Rhododendron molle TaxID=49168 RepID=A0ACC0NCU9_RHOML|nr:hypothetical protein RHMOL_Rhmol06G0143600 [Rhododendron molle]
MGSTVAMVVRLRRSLIQSRIGSSGVSHISALGAERLQAASMLLGISVEWCLVFVRVGFGLVFFFGLLVLFFGVPKFLPVCRASLTPAWVVLLLSAVLRLFGVEGLVGVGCSLWIRVPSF